MAALPLCVGCCGGGDEEQRRTHLRVPEMDTSPPEVRLRIVGADGRTVADSGGELAPDRVHFPRVELRGTLRAVAVGRDEDGGLGRIRVSIIESVECRDVASGRVRRERAVRYLPPPAIERIKITPGTRTPVERRRSASVGGRPGACAAGERAVGARGNIWAEATNAHGLEAVSSHLLFSQRR